MLINFQSGTAKLQVLYIIDSELYCAVTNILLTEGKWR